MLQKFCLVPAEGGAQWYRMRNQTKLLICLIIQFLGIQIEKVYFIVSSLDNMSK